MENRLEILQPYCANNMNLLKRISKSIFMKFNEPLANADYDDFYSIANMTLWQAYQAYNANMGVSFYGFLYSCLQKKFKTELTRRHRQKRVFDNYNISLDAAIVEDDCNLLDCVVSDFDTFEEVIKKQGKEQFTDKVQRYISRLSSRQINILNLLINGYKPIDIRNTLNISAKEYTDNLQIMRAYENVKILF